MNMLLLNAKSIFWLSLAFTTCLNFNVKKDLESGLVMVNDNGERTVLSYDF